jgi:hypothetical protein
LPLDDVEAEVLGMAKDPHAPDHLRLGALKQLALVKRKGRPRRWVATAEPTTRQPECARSRSRPVDPLLWTWLPYCPGDPEKAKRDALSAARRLKLDRGPDEPEDELAARRRGT